VNFLKVILATIVIFGAGVITGGLLVAHVKHPAYSHPPHPPAPPVQPNETGDMPGQLRAPMLNKQFVEQLDDELQLTKEQREQIQKIIAQGQQSTRDLWKLVGPQFQIVWRDTRQQIRNVLTPEQRKQFEVLMKQQRHPASTNAPPAQVIVPTNAPLDQPPAPTNGPAV
jgi:Spy/CpxP family protein refolding chaperone